MSLDPPRNTQHVPNPFTIEVHRPSVAFNGDSPLVQMNTRNNPAGRLGARSSNFADALERRRSSRSKSPSAASMMRVENPNGNASFTSNANYSTLEPTTPYMNASARSGVATSVGARRRSRLGVSPKERGLSVSGGVTPKSRGGLAVPTGPSVRIKSPAVSSLNNKADRGSDSDKGETSDSGSSRSTSDSGSSSTSSVFSVGSSLNFERIKSYFLRRKKGSKGIALQSSSMYLFEGDSVFRLIVFNLIKSKVFEGFIILLIVANCVLLALNDPMVPNEPWQDKVDYAFTAAFTVEMFLKFIALGIVMHKGAYFRDPWNILDFLIVVLSYMGMLPDVGNFTALRIFRVLRPLRSLNAVPPLKIIVSGLFHSIKGLANVGVLSLLVICIFAIVGVQLWQGQMVYRCRNDYTGDINPEAYCAQVSSRNFFSGKPCDEGFTCVPYMNPWDNYVSFDNIGWAFLIVMQCVTVEGWSEIQSVQVDMVGWYSVFYYVIVVLIMNYFILNLALAVIEFQFSNVKERTQERLREEKEEEELEMLAAAEEEDELLYGRTLMPAEQSTNFLDQAKGGTAAVEGPTGTLTTLQMRMLKKTVGGRLLYSLEKAQKIINFKRLRQQQKAAVDGEDTERDALVEMTEKVIHTPPRAASPTIATLALLNAAHFSHGSRPLTQNGDPNTNSSSVPLPAIMLEGTPANTALKVTSSNNNSKNNSRNPSRKNSSVMGAVAEPNMSVSLSLAPNTPNKQTAIVGVGGEPDRLTPLSASKNNLHPPPQQVQL